ncbi:MAG TPA: hypothetical protein VJC05_03430 [Candidatus Andersenbacteria bacterium]|nr:hypothetical protein [Candidatus Andersenbacteria bacterium]
MLLKARGFFIMVGERLEMESGKYVAAINDSESWKDLCATLGQTKWEVPRGIAPATDADVEQAILKIASKEALEEAGFTLAGSARATSY